MRRSDRQSAFSLLELLVVMATILLLAGALLGVGKYVTTRASADLTESELEVIATALQQYYDDMGDFPFNTDIDLDGDSFTDQNGNGFFDSADLPDYSETVIETDPANGLIGSTLPNGSLENLGAEAASSAALFYYLDQNPNSRAIVEALTDSLISNKNVAGAAITFIFTATGQTIDFPRFIDAWGTSIRYEFLPGTAFPVLTSAGPDKLFGTADDIKS